MDKITENLIEDYTKNSEIAETKIDKKFELFSCYSTVSKDYGESFDIEDVWLDDESTGIDGLAIIVNGQLINSKEEVDDLVNSNNYLEAVFIFIQAKTSSNFDSKEVGNFIFAVSDFFEVKPTIPKGARLEEKSNIVNYIYSKSSSMTRGSPACKLYYVTTGIWTNDAVLSGRISTGQKDLIDKNIFNKVNFVPLGAREIQKYYQDTKSGISREITFTNKTILPQIIGIEQAYIGTLDFKEFIKLITDEESKILNSVFYDNIRAFQGENSVNKKIRETLEAKKFDEFCILNNGITIVARSLIVTGIKFALTDYSIVNGCQTSHVLYNSRDIEGIDKTNLPVRLIVTSDEEIRNDVIRATNNQTEVKLEELEALSDFQKSLELFYDSMKGDMRLYYERRSKQFSNTQITKTRIITIPIQIKSFAAMFLDKPHLSSRFYGRLIKEELGKKIFLKDDKPIIYYTAALTYFKLEQLFRNNGVDTKYKKCRYHLLMLVPYVVNGINRPAYNSNKIEEYCNKIIEKFQDPIATISLFQEVTNIVDESGININDPEPFKAQSTNDLLLKKFTSQIVKGS